MKVQRAGPIVVVVLGAVVLTSGALFRLKADATGWHSSIAAGTNESARERDLFDELHARGQKQNAGLKTLTASFVETSTSSLLTRPVVARGTVIVERPARVALRYTDPDARVVLIDGDRLTMSWPAANMRSVKDIGASQRRVQKYFVDSSPDELRRQFEVSAQEAHEPAGTYVISMVPRRKQILEGLTRLELWLDRTTLLLSAMRMTFPSGDTKTMTFTDVKPNAAIDASLFKIPGAASPSR